MKYQLIIIGVLTVASYSLQSQTASPAPAPSAPAQSGTVVSPGAGQTPVTGMRQQLLQRQQILQNTPALPSQSVLPGTAAATAQGATTAQAVNSPGQGLVATNQVPTNPILTNASEVILPDRAVTPADNSLLIRIRQAVNAQVQGKSPWAAVRFEVANGVVTLTGTVESLAQRQQAVALIQRTPGVVSVVDQLTTSSVQQAVTGPDQAQLLRVRQSVLPQIQIANSATPVDFSVQQGVVTMQGTVPNVQQKRFIGTLVRQVPGVVQVTDQLRVNNPALLNAGTPIVAPANTGGNQIMPNATVGTTQAAPSLTPTGRANNTTPLPQR